MICLRYFAAVAALGLLCGGCETVPAASSYDGYRDAPVAGPNGAIKLQAGDKLRITVFGEDKLSGEYDIDPSGYVSLPLAGTIKAGGRTKIDLERDLTSKFKNQYLQNPKVTVDVIAFRPFYVMGEVAHPGEFPYKTTVDVMSAIATAGGQTYRASRSTVLIRRAGREGFQEYPLSPDIPVYPGDLIRVPERYF